mmetsp:Transcript_116661/g.329986  ORF Transcript_116661/g.329986 Transcript_116661/m.329986 type:complete len:241 (+) Transcript_116661:217-939(+)
MDAAQAIASRRARVAMAEGPSAIPHIHIASTISSPKAIDATTWVLEVAAVPAFAWKTVRAKVQAGPSHRVRTPLRAALRALHVQRRKLGRRCRAILWTTTALHGPRHASMTLRSSTSSSLVIGAECSRTRPSTTAIPLFNRILTPMRRCWLREGWRRLPRPASRSLSSTLATIFTQEASESLANATLLRAALTTRGRQASYSVAPSRMSTRGLGLTASSGGVCSETMTSAGMSIPRIGTK